MSISGHGKVLMKLTHKSGPETSVEIFFDIFNMFFVDSCFILCRFPICKNAFLKN